MFGKILIANRGEIAVRVIRTCRRLGVATVVVYSEADADSLAVEMADEAVAIGPPPAAQSYLRGEAVIAAALATGAEAIHPGFGFLSENAAFARACAQAGVVFIGPNPAAIEAMGDKIASKTCAVRAGVSVVPGHIGEIADAAAAVDLAEAIGYPIMLKASAGGGGKGIRVAHTRRDVEEGFPAVRAEAAGAFGDDRIFIEKFIENPRHIEIQVLGDKHGHIVHLFERECSIQRRNQKVVEEAPSPLLDGATRATMGAQAVALARAVDYDSAGTVEFVAGQDRAFYFLEMNTRLQVEHPVTEMITGVDLVEQMMRSAAGEPLAFAQDDLSIDGWAIESRLYAEDPYRNFLPSIGRLVRYRTPAEGEHGAARVRVDTGVREGDDISMFYDPMIAKLAAWGPDRGAAVAAMASALEELEIDGVGHNAPFLSAVMSQERFAKGALSTSYIADEFPGGFHGLPPSPWQKDAMAAAAVWMHRVAMTRARGGRPHRVQRRDWIVFVAGERRPLRVEPIEEDLVLAFADENRQARLESVAWRPGAALFKARLDGRSFAATVAPAAEGFDIRVGAARARVLVLSPVSAELHGRLPPRPPADTSRQVLSPMPGLVISCAVVAGEAVEEGQILFVVEAMKMQNIVRAERAGTLAEVAAATGDSVAADDVLARFA